MRTNQLQSGDLYLSGAGFHIVLAVKADSLQVMHLKEFRVVVLNMHTDICGAVVFRDGSEIHRGKYADDLMSP